MALTIENGSGVTGADSFATVAEFDAGLLDYFNETSAETEPAKEAALRRAWLYMKSLSWNAGDEAYPTFGGTIPDDVKTAQVIFARAELATPNGLQPSVVPGQQKILTRVGEISWTATGSSGTDAQRSVVTMAADLLNGYLSGSGQTKFIARA